jgi:hypothetical protein
MTVLDTYPPRHDWTKQSRTWPLVFSISLSWVTTAHGLDCSKSREPGRSSAKQHRTATDQA